MEITKEELEKTYFWILYWVKSIRGGHYWFEILTKRMRELRKV